MDSSWFSKIPNCSLSTWFFAIATGFWKRKKQKKCLFQWGCPRNKHKKTERGFLHSLTTANQAYAEQRLAIHPKRLVAAYIYIVWTKWQIFAYFEPQKKISLPLMQRKKVRGTKGALCIVVVYIWFALVEEYVLNKLCTIGQSQLWMYSRAFPYALLTRDWRENRIWLVPTLKKESEKFLWFYNIKGYGSLSSDVIVSFLLRNNVSRIGWST